jgi:hypothetical protein
MNARLTFLAVFAITLASVGRASAYPSASELQNAIMGAHTLVSVTFVYENGTRSDPYGPGVKGEFTATKDRFSFQIMGERPKFAASNRWSGTAEENAADIRATESIFGTYTIDAASQSIVLHMERAIFPNWDGTDRAYTMVLHGNQIEMVGPRTPSPQGFFQPHLLWQ